MKEKFLRFEKYVFLLVTAVHLMPVVLLQYFVTHDGPAHVYSASIIDRLIGSDALNNSFFQFNPFPVPNWLGHVLLSMLNLFLDGNISERIIIGLYIILLPVSFRYFLLTLNPNAQWASYLCFPFIYSLLFYLGFYNFLLGMTVLFFSLTFLIRNQNNLSTKNLFVIALLSLLLYFCHLFVLAFFILAAAALSLTDFFATLREKKSWAFRTIMYGKPGKLLLALTPCLLLMLLFLFTHQEKGDTFGAMIKTEALYNLFIARPLITLRFDTEFDYAVTISCAFWILLLFNIIIFFSKVRFDRNAALLVLSCLILIAYFFVPDQLGSGSFVSHRLLMFFYLFALLWIGTNTIPTPVKIASSCFFVMVSLVFLSYHYDESSKLDTDTQEYVSAGSVIKTGSVVLPLSYSGNWLHTNISNYISADKNIIMLDNYEAAMPHFPLEWKKEMNPYTGMNFSSLDLPCTGLAEYEKATGRKIDYILRWGFNDATNDSCANVMDHYIREKYTCIFVSSQHRGELFIKKENLHKR